MKTTSEKKGVRYVHSLSEDWERRGEGRGRGGRQRGGLVQYFYGCFFLKDFLFFIYFIFLALKIPEGISLLFMPRLFKKKTKTLKNPSAG